MLSRRNFLLSGAAAAADRSKKKRPNILLLMTDQQRFDSLGCYGSTAGSDSASGFAGPPRPGLRTLLRE